MGKIFFSCRHDLQSIKKPFIFGINFFLSRIFEKVTEHTHDQSFPKTMGTDEQVCFLFFIQAKLQVEKKTRTTCFKGRMKLWLPNLRKNIRRYFFNDLCRLLPACWCFLKNHSIIHIYNCYSDNSASKNLKTALSHQPPVQLVV